MANRIVIFGAGRLGSLVSEFVVADGSREVFLVDGSEEALDLVATDARKVVMDGNHADKVDSFLAQGDIVVAAGASHLCLPLAKAALRNRCHYLDFNESATTTNWIHALEGNGFSKLVPSCGLSPGLLSALIADFSKSVAGPFDLGVYVGVIPKEKTNRLGYGLIMSIEGLLEEYFGKAYVKSSGEWLEIEPLSLEETVTIDGVSYEAFATGGTTNQLPKAVAPKVRNYVYRTLRYPGHLDYMRFLLDDLKLRGRRDMLSNILRNGLPSVENDQVVIRLSASGFSGRRYEERHVRTWKIEGQAQHGGSLYDIAARHAATVIDLICEGPLADHGVIRQEDIDASLILSHPYIKGLFD